MFNNTFKLFVDKETDGVSSYSNIITIHIITLVQENENIQNVKDGQLLRDSATPVNSPHIKILIKKKQYIRFILKL